MGIVPREERFGCVPDYSEVPAVELAETVGVLPESDRMRLEAYLDALIDECGAGLSDALVEDVAIEPRPQRRMVRRRLRLVAAELPEPLTPQFPTESGRAA